MSNTADYLRNLADQIKREYRHSTRFGSLSYDQLDLGTDTELVEDTLLRVSGSADIYLKVYELWQPVVELLQQDPTADWHTVTDYNKLNYILNRLYNIDYELPDLTINLDQVDQKSCSLDQLFTTVFQQLDGAAGLHYQSPTMVKNKHHQALIADCLTSLADYIQSADLYKQHIHNAGKNIMAQIVAQMNPADTLDFNEFFDFWIEYNEREFEKLFNTDLYTKLKTDLTNSATQAKIQYARFLEQQYADYPLVTKKDFKELLELVDSLQKQIKELQR